MDKKVIAVGLSGGVDSSVAAALLKEKGYEVIGLTMKIWDNSIDLVESGKDACFGPGEEVDINFASELCEKLDIPYHVIDLTKEYKTEILEYFRNEYLAGRTPNPCVKCNHTMKFGFLLDKARETGINFDLFATGHYADLSVVDGDVFLKKTDDNPKDQTYFLSRLKKEQLKNIIFPLGNLKKNEVRDLALKYSLASAGREESQDFISGGDYSPLFKESEIKPGEIIDESGKILGTHKGIIYYTIGQRKGLGISSEKPLYVYKIDARKNRIIVSDKEYLFKETALVDEVNWFINLNKNEELDCVVKIRQKHRETEAVITRVSDDEIQISFNAPQLSVTPGQIAVAYDREGKVLLSGIIK